ncbi:carbohydrate kinase [Treponema sp. OMZ 840]|uniref:carbohydrate kinase family protein n=1 Tax=Treponema sp. OMZ 840 TaxID=244313 RepID=UPI003D93E0A3
MHAKNIDVSALGELLIDFTPSGISEQGNRLMEVNPGGAPANLLAMLNKLGHSTSFIGKVGDDMFGRLLKSVLEDLKIGTENLIVSKTDNTTLAFVHIKDDGDRDFSFYRKNGADVRLSSGEVSEDILSRTRIFHYGSLSMTAEPAASATEYAIACAKNYGALCSFDPNLRVPLWDNLAHAKERIKYGLSQCDILKIAEEELEFITGCKDITEGVCSLRSSYNIPLIGVTCGKKGASLFYADENCTDGLGLHESLPTFKKVKTIDTTGAGDTFAACILHDVLVHGFTDFTKERLHSMLLFANAAASLVTEKKGALRVMPGEKDIQALIAKGL